MAEFFTNKRLSIIHLACTIAFELAGIVQLIRCHSVLKCGIFTAIALINLFLYASYRKAMREEKAENAENTGDGGPAEAGEKNDDAEAEETTENSEEEKEEN